MKSILNLFALMLLLLLVCAGCGDDDDSPTTPPTPDAQATIGAAGGTLEIDGAAAMDVPAGALQGDVAFTMDDAGDDHATMVSTRGLAAPVFSIGPSGTTFDAPVILTLHYDEADLGGVDESDILIYTDSGSGWTALPTTVNEAANTAIAQITHLSDFVVTVPSGEAADGVYALFEVVRFATSLGEGLGNAYTDMIVARFDGVVNPCAPIEPMHPDSVWCNEYPLEWDDSLTGYLDTSTEAEFLDLGGTYTFHVTASADVPALEESIDMVDSEPVITNLQNLDTVPTGGFTVQWSDCTADTVTVVFALSEEAVLAERVPNTGSHTFAAADLADLAEGTYVLSVSYHEKRFLTDVAGYDPNSYILAAVTSNVVLTLADGGGEGIGPDGGTLLLGDDGRLEVPAGALDAVLTLTAVADDTPPAGLDGYTLLTPVYDVGPSGTVFAADATLEFDYDDGDLGTADEADVVIVGHDGTAWSVLDSDVDEALDQVAAPVSHLSHFVAAVPTPAASEGVYAVIETAMTHIPVGGGTVMRADGLHVRFDAVAADDPVTPLQAGGVTIGEWALVWGGDDFEYTDAMAMDFMALDQSYDCVVTASDDVPVLDVAFDTPAAAVYADLTANNEVTLDGYTLRWVGDQAGGDVEITVVGPGAGGLQIVVPNSGSHTFTAADFDGIEPGAGQIALVWVSDEATITAEGYHASSLIRHIQTSINTVVFAAAAPQQVLYTEMPNLAIPDAPSGPGYGDPVTDTITVSESGTLTDLRVYLSIDHDYASDLTVKLMSPERTEIRLFWICEGGEPGVDPAGWYPDDFTPKDDLATFFGEGIGGDWTITAQDMSQAEAGTLLEWRLELTYQ